MGKLSKGYLHYKMTTSQNVPSKAQVNIFLSYKKFMYRPRDIEVFIFLPIPWFTQSVISCWDLGHKTGSIFKYLLNYNSVIHQTWSVDRYRLGQYFSEIFWMMWRTKGKIQTLFNLAICLKYSGTNYAKLPGFDFFERVNGKCQLLKIEKSNYIVNSLKL